MKQKFLFEYEDTSPRNLKIDYAGVAEEFLRVTTETGGGACSLYINRDSALVLARIFAQLSQCDFEPGFHLHIGEDFDAEKQDALTLVLTATPEGS